MPNRVYERCKHGAIPFKCGEHLWEVACGRGQVSVDEKGWDSKTGPAKQKLKRCGLYSSVRALWGQRESRGRSGRKVGGASAPCEVSCTRMQLVGGRASADCPPGTVGTAVLKTDSAGPCGKQCIVHS